MKLLKKYGNEYTMFGFLIVLVLVAITATVGVKKIMTSAKNLTSSVKSAVGLKSVTEKLEENVISAIDNKEKVDQETAVKLQVAVEDVKIVMSEKEETARIAEEAATIAAEDQTVEAAEIAEQAAAAAAQAEIDEAAALAALALEEEKARLEREAADAAAALAVLELEAAEAKAAADAEAAEAKAAADAKAALNTVPPLPVGFVPATDWAKNRFSGYRFHRGIDAAKSGGVRIATRVQNGGTSSAGYLKCITNPDCVGISNTGDTFSGPFKPKSEWVYSTENTNGTVGYYEKL